MNRKMTGGFAILATPVKYAETGIMTFMTSQRWRGLRARFGARRRSKIAASIQEYNPDENWWPVV